NRIQDIDEAHFKSQNNFTSSQSNSCLSEMTGVEMSVLGNVHRKMNSYCKEELEVTNFECGDFTMYLQMQQI
ncbi:hypothetical protein KUCAC02_012374, partial [Chaenocephalus aceratus]